MNPKQKQPKPQKYKRNDLVVVKEGAELINKPGEMMEEDHSGVVLGYQGQDVIVHLLDGRTNVVVEESYVAPNQERR